MPVSLFFFSFFVPFLSIRGTSSTVSLKHLLSLFFSLFVYTKFTMPLTWPGGLSNHGNDVWEVKNCHGTPESGTGSPQSLSGIFNLEIDSLELEEEIDQVLRALRKAQQTEYKIAEERLLAQKNCLLNLYRQLDKERSELSMAKSSDDQDVLLEAILKRVDQIKREIVKLRDMEVVAKGFGKTSKDILDQHFRFETE